MRVETSKWSGEGTFTQLLIERLQTVDTIEEIRAEDAPASRSDADYNFISNEIFVLFASRPREIRTTQLGFIPRVKVVNEPAMSMAELEQRLASIEDVGAADYSDDGLIQFLRTERIIPPYQTRGYKIVELVRIYDATKPPRTDT